MPEPCGFDEASRTPYPPTLRADPARIREAHYDVTSCIADICHWTNGGTCAGMAKVKPVATTIRCQPAVNMAGPAVNMNMAGPADLSDLVDARGSGGETQLLSRGFVLARTRGLTAFWWNGSSGTCAKVVTNEGRYQSVDTVAPSECGY